MHTLVCRVFKWNYEQLLYGQSFLPTDIRFARANAPLSILNYVHFVLKSPAYCDLRQKYIKQYYGRRPSVFKLVQLLSVNTVKELCSLGKFIRDAFKLRFSLLS